MNRLFEIAYELNQVNISRMGYRRNLQTIERDRKAYEMQMIPEGGWPGKNADERKAAEMTAKANDDQLYGYEVQRQTVEFNLDTDELHREALIEERDAIRWTIRDREQKAINGFDASVLDQLASMFASTIPQPEVETQEAPQENKSLFDLNEQQRDDVAAQIRLAELDNISPACQWELDEIQLPESAKAARIRYDEIMQVQGAYEEKYHL